jgi:isopentenyl phosphate kinase
VTTVSVVREASRLVVKVGSSLVTNGGQGLDLAALAQWAEQIAALARGGKEVLLVSSGAVAEGMQRLGWKRRPKALHDLQAAAAVGQMGLVQAYETCFRKHGLQTAQILLTHEDLANRGRYLNARSTLRTLLSLGIIPIINENDTVATDEIRFGDNDTLGSLVTNLVEAEVLIILTDQPGLYTADPRKDPSATLVQRRPRRRPRARGHGRWRRFGHRIRRDAHQGARSPSRRPQRCAHRDRVRPRGPRPAASRGRREDRIAARRRDADARRAQAVAGRSPAAARQARARRRCRPRTARRRQEPAAHRRAGCPGRFRTRRGRRVPRRRRP